MIVVAIIFIIVFGVIMFGISNQIQALINQVSRVADNISSVENKLDEIHRTQKTRF